jgi:hypothetical protein
MMMMMMMLIMMMMMMMMIMMMTHSRGGGEREHDALEALGARVHRSIVVQVIKHLLRQVLGAYRTTTVSVEMTEDKRHQCQSCQLP